MQERFSVSTRTSRRNLETELEAGLDEWDSNPVGPDGPRPDLREEFELELAPDPLDIKDFERDLERFLDKHIVGLVPALLDEAPPVGIGDLVEQLEMTNEKLARFSDGYALETLPGSDQQVLSYREPDHPEPIRLFNAVDDPAEWLSDYLIALAYLSETTECHVRVDSDGKTRKRFWWKPAGRYLAGNDAMFELRIIGQPGEPDNEQRLMAATRVRTVEITNSLNTVAQVMHRDLKEKTEPLARMIELGHEDLQQLFDELVTDEDSPDLGQAWVANRTSALWNAVTEGLEERLRTDPQARAVILAAEPAQDVFRDLRYRQDRTASWAAEYFGFTTDSYIDEFERFQAEKDDLPWDSLVSDRRGGGEDPLHYFYLGESGIPVIYNPEIHDTKTFPDMVRRSVGELLALCAGNENEAIRDTFHRLASLNFPGRGMKPEQQHSNHVAYRLAERVSLDDVEAFLGDDAFRTVNEVANGCGLLEMLGQLGDLRGRPLLEACAKVGRPALTGAWEIPWIRADHRTEGLSDAECREVLEKTIRTYEIGAALYRAKTGAEPPEGREWLEQIGVLSDLDWWLYASLPPERPVDELAGLLKDHDNLFRIAVVALDAGDPESAKHSTESYVRRLLEFVESGGRLQSLVFAGDTYTHVQALLDGSVDHAEDVLADWPEPLRSELTDQEVRLALKYANQLQLDDGGVRKLAEWREWRRHEGLSELPSAKDLTTLQTYVCWASQPELFRDSLAAAAETIGGNTVLKFLNRVANSRDRTGFSMEWTAVIEWSPYVDKLSSREWRMILGSIQGREDLQELSLNLKKYDSERDPLAARGPVRSVRHLISRVRAIEIGLQEADIDPRLNGATNAPGFDFTALRRVNQDPRFRHLLDGELDQRQPFRPERRELSVQPLSRLVDEALGSQQRNVPGRAQRPKKLYHRLKHLLLDAGSEKSVTDLTVAVPSELAEPVAAVLREYGVTPDETLVAELHAKSDPEGWVCGNYTDSCMPFGDTKTTDYMYSPGTQFFSVRYRGRTIATSVVVDCIDRKTGSRTVLLDNIEVANNYKNMLPSIEQAYLEFWNDYTERPVKVGAREKDPTLGGKMEIGAKIRPIHRIGYSDAANGTIHSLPEAA